MDSVSTVGLDHQCIVQRTGLFQVFDFVGVANYPVSKVNQFPGFQGFELIGVLTWAAYFKRLTGKLGSVSKRLDHKRRWIGRLHKNIALVQAQTLQMLSPLLPGRYFPREKGCELVALAISNNNCSGAIGPRCAQQTLGVDLHVAQMLNVACIVGCAGDADQHRLAAVHVCKVVGDVTATAAEGLREGIYFTIEKGLRVSA